MKGWLVSVGVHLLLLLVLWCSTYPTSPKIIPKKSIQAFTYTPPKAAVPEPLPPPMSAAEPATPLPTPATPVKPKTDAPSRAKTTPAKPARIATEPKNEAASPVQTTPVTPPAKRGSLASRALSSATGAAPIPATSFSVQQAKQDARLTEPSKAPANQTPAKTIKKLSNGAELVKTADGSCWQLPSAEQRKSGIWTRSSIPCEPDTTIEQLNEIFKKRRELRRD
ncbi:MULTISPECIES: hypothetical protein [Rheinheimera]|uniref:Cell envelope biogenesis protein TolA n=1 Tax=Rheinheimera marina TaxID=1774958 RepID=A0ABV9JM89_9GAMM